MPDSGTLTYDDLVQIPDDGKRRELLDGELVVSASPAVRHQIVAQRIFFALESHVRERGGATVFFAPLDIILSPETVVEPDVFVILDEQRDIITEPNIKGVPALVVEVLSNPRIDRVRKRQIYARFGVPRYWIADPDADRIEIHRLAGGEYGKPEILEIGDRLTYPPLSGFQVSLSDLFAR